jgi:FlaA1/EpsC-like NDP-sugar epimerase
MAAGIDSVICALTVWIALYLRLGHFVSLSGRPSLAVLLSIAIAIPIFFVSGLYRVSFRRTGSEIVPLIAIACTAYGLCYATLISAYSFENLPRTVGIIQPILLFLTISATRVGVGRILQGQPSRGQRRSEQKALRVLIYGAGSSGTQLAEAISVSQEFSIVGFLDDDASLQGTKVASLPVYSPDSLESLILSAEVDDIFLALPSAPRQRRNEIIADLRSLPVRVRTLPGLIDLAHGRVDASDLRELTIEDLLSREPVDPEIEKARQKIGGQTILVTGAGGSIGSELCRQIASLNPRRLLLLENNEYALYSIHRALADVTNAEIVPLLASVTDEARIQAIIATWRPTMIFHAAAYKHVPLVEHNPLEGLRNNVIGTLCLARVAVEMEVSDFVLISTDKAVRPTNIMGATKRMAELILQGLAQAQTTTCFSMVRFGNVLGSSGSVVPLFREQIQRGGPITITHLSVTRYFMTIPEAAQLVLQASAMAKGGEVFVLDMGEPVKIYDLACNMIELCGFTVRSAANPHGDIEIVVVGMRPGEKLYEELLIGDDPQTTTHPRVMMARERHFPWNDLLQHLTLLQQKIDSGDVLSARKIIIDIVPEYTPSGDIVDWLHLQQNTS